jgi:flagellin
MALTINTNTMSLNAQRNLSNSALELSTSLQRLSSGLRINSAKDDAAGMAIASRFTTQIRGLNQAVRNANDGISLAQTAEGALGELENNLQRIRELAVQSANSSNSASDRAALDLEVQQRLAEVERIGAQTTFNGQRVLDGTFGTANFQVGANVGDVISISLSQGVKASQVGQIATQTGGAVSTGNLTGTGTVQVGSSQAKNVALATQGAAAGQSVGSAYAKAAAVNAASVPGLTAIATNNVEFGVAATTGTAVNDTYSLRINGADIFASYDQNVNGVLTTQQITDAINGQSAVTGVSATLSGGNLRLSAIDGRDINIGQLVGGAAGGGITAGAGGNSTVNGVVFRDGVIAAAVTNATAYSSTAGVVNGGTVTLSASENVIVTGDGTALGFASATTTIAKDTTTLASQNVLTVQGANATINRVDSALTNVSNLRSRLGAIQSRFESTVSNLQATSENLTASRSRILDADFAAETAAMTRAQILQQAGTAILAQANAVPQNALSLLR